MFYARSQVRIHSIKLNKEVAMFLNKLKFFMLFIFMLLAIGCEDDNIIVSGDFDPPAIPRGLRSISGDGKVILVWFPNTERDLGGYNIYFSFDNESFELIATTADTIYVDNDVRNGITFFYAITAFDVDGNESDLTILDVFDTPRPEGFDVQLANFRTTPGMSGFSFELELSNASGILSANSPDADFYFELDPNSGLPFILAGNRQDARETLILDAGLTFSFEDVDFAPDPNDPTSGYLVNGRVRAIPNHTYILQTDDGNFAQIRVTNLVDGVMIFDWAYQLVPNNPDFSVNEVPKT